MQLAKFKEFLSHQRIDTALFYHPDPSITYFTQKQFSYAILSVQPKSTKLYLSKLDSFPSLPGVKVECISKNVNKNLFRKNFSRIGINKESITLTLFEKLGKTFPKAVFVDVGAKVRELRQIKTEEEILKLTRACDITVRAFQELVKRFSRRNLQTELDVATFLECFVRKEGGELAFPTIVASGGNSVIPHHPTSLDPLRKGFLQLDFGAKWENYCADMSRVIYLGSPSRKEIKDYQLLLSVQQRCLNQVKEATTFKSLHSFAQQELGYFSKYFPHSLGHGIGIEVHEEPIFKDPRSKIKENQVFTIEPGIYLPNKYGLRIEDTVFWDGRKLKILTHASKELITLPF